MQHILVQLYVFFINRFLEILLTDSFIVFCELWIEGNVEIYFNRSSVNKSVNASKNRWSKKPQLEEKNKKLPTLNLFAQLLLLFHLRWINLMCSYALCDFY